MERDRRVRPVTADYASDRLLYASLYPTSPTLQTAGIRSSDGGDTWQNGATEGLCPGWAADMRFSSAFAEDRTVFALQQGAVFKECGWRRHVASRLPARGSCVPDFGSSR